MRTRWAQPLPRFDTWGSPVQSASNVYVPTGTTLSAFRRDSGTPLWADRAGQEVHGHLWATTWGLFSRAPEFCLERRALDSGEVERIWPYKEKVIAVAPSGRLVAIATEDGSLWLIRSHDGGQMVGRPDATSRR